MPWGPAACFNCGAPGHQARDCQEPRPCKFWEQGSCTKGAYARPSRWVCQSLVLRVSFHTTHSVMTIIACAQAGRAPSGMTLKLQAEAAQAAFDEKTAALQPLLFLLASAHFGPRANARKVRRVLAIAESERRLNASIVFGSQITWPMRPALPDDEHAHVCLCWWTVQARHASFFTSLKAGSHQRLARDPLSKECKKGHGRKRTVKCLRLPYWCMGGAT